MQERVIFAGFGGQGIMLMGKLLAYAAMEEGKFTTWMPSYGAEVRGGTAHSMVVVSDKEIASPIVTSPDSCIVMNRPSFEKFENVLKRRGLFVVNGSLVKENGSRRDWTLLRLPLTDEALMLGNMRVANMVAMGAYVAKKKVVSFENLINVLKKVIPPHRQSLLPINEKALRRGRELVEDLTYDQG